MASNIKLKRSAVPGRIPTTTDLDLGEVGLNTYDGQAYIKRKQGENEKIVSLNPVDRYGGNRVYVSAANGNDSNDGIEFPVASIRQACIVASGMPKPVTIYVATGDYIENNPIIVNDNISIIGDNLRGAVIRPLNANKDIFRIRNKVLIEGVVFRDHLDNNGNADYTWRYAIAFDDVEDTTVNRVPYTGLSSAKPIISTSPYIKDCSIISFLGGNGALIDGSRIAQFNTPLNQSEVELPVAGAAPVQGKSMVAAYFTILSFGGTAWHIINDAYAQLVSCFQIFCKHGVYAQSGGYASITNSASNFGIYALRGSGYRDEYYIFDQGIVSNQKLITNKQALEVIGTLRPVINHYVIRLYSTTSHTATNATYNPLTGVSTITVANHGFAVGEEILIKDESLTFTCSSDGNVTQLAHPRSTDPASGTWLKILNVTTNTFNVNVGPSGPNDQYTHTFVSADTDGILHRSEVTSDYKTPGTQYTIAASTDVNIIDDYISEANHGLLNEDSVLYDANGNDVIGGLIDNTVYFVKYINDNTFQLYEDESLQYKINLTSTSSGTHYFYSNVEDFFVDNVDSYHNSYQNITIPAGSYTFNVGQQIIGTSGPTTSNGTVYSWDADTRILVVSVNKVQIGDIQVRNIFVSGMTIEDHSPTPQPLFIGTCESRTDLYTSEFNVSSTIIGNTVQNISGTVGKLITLHRPSVVNSSGHTWEFIGSGIDYNALPENGGQKVEAYEQYEDYPGRVYSSGTDELGDFKVGKFIRAENRSGEISFSQRVVIGELSSLKLSISDISIDEFSKDAGLGDNEIGGATHSRISTQKATRDFLNNRLGDFIDKNVSINSVPNSVVQLNSAGKLNLEIIPPIRNFNTYKTTGLDSRYELYLDIPAIDAGAGDLVTETVNGVDTSYILQSDNISQFIVIDSTQTINLTGISSVEGVISSSTGSIDTAKGINGLESGVAYSGTITSAGSGYTPTSGSQVYSNVSLTSGSGSGAKADITVTNGTITNIDLRRGGSGYAVNNILTVNAANIGGTGTGFQYTVSSIQNRLYINLTGERIKFNASTTNPDYIADANAPTNTITNTATSQLTFDASADVDYVNYVITIASHGLASGDYLIYDSSPNIAIGGLLNNQIYYIKVLSSSTFELYTEYGLNAANKISFTSSSSGTHKFTLNRVSVLNNRLYIPSHGFSTSDPVKVIGSNVPGGLVNTEYYFVGSVTQNTFTLHSTKASATSSVSGTTVSPVDITSIGSGTTTLTKSNITIVGSISTSTQYSTNWAVLSGANADAANIVSGVLDPARLAYSGTASDKTFLRGDQVWARAVQGISEETGSPLTLVGDSYVDGSDTVYFNKVKLGINKVSGSTTGTSGFTQIGVAAFNKSQFEVTSDGDVTIRPLVVDAITLNGNNDQYYLNPANFNSTVPVLKGGTNITSYAKGDILYGNVVNTLSKLAIGNESEVLTVRSGVPVWSTLGIVVVKAKTTTNLTATYSNGTSGVGATLTGSSSGILPTFDGVTLSVGDKVLINDQTDKAHNGVYEVTNVGSVSTSYILTRPTISDSIAELGIGYILVQQGSPENTTFWKSNVKTGFTIGTSGIEYYKNVNSGDTLYVDDVNHRIGINDSTPDYSLDINGTLRVTSTATFNGNASFGDNDAASFGGSNQLQIYYDSTFGNSTILETGSGNLLLGGSHIQFRDSTLSEIYATFTSNGTAELYFDNSKKFETTSVGVTITGDLTLTENEIFDANSLKGSYTATTTTTTQTSILSISAVNYRSFEILVQMTEGSKYHIEKILVVHDGSTVYTTTYGTITTNGSLATFDLDIVSNNLRLLATAASSNSTTYKFTVTAIKV
jgi:hypothetical protein